MRTVNAFYNPMKLQKEAFNTYNYICLAMTMKTQNKFIIVLFNSPVHFIVGPRVIMPEWKVLLSNAIAYGITRDVQLANQNKLS